MKKYSSHCCYPTGDPAECPNCGDAPTLPGSGETGSASQATDDLRRHLDGLIQWIANEIADDSYPDPLDKAYAEGLIAQARAALGSAPQAPAGGVEVSGGEIRQALFAVAGRNWCHLCQNYDEECGCNPNINQRKIEAVMPVILAALAAHPATGEA